MKKNMRRWIIKFEIIDSIIGVIGVLFILAAALSVQFFYHEAPCPLCKLQRVAFINLGLALLLNARYGNRVSHWALAILSSVAGIAVSTRQILLHINSPIGMGSVIFGLHMYTWSFIAFSIAIIGSILMLIIYPETINKKW